MKCVRKGSGKKTINEPKWFSILNPIFADTLGDVGDVASCSSDVFHEESDDSSSDDELLQCKKHINSSLTFILLSTNRRTSDNCSL